MRQEMGDIRWSDLASHVTVIASIVLIVSAMLLPWYHHSVTRVGSWGNSTTDVSLYLLDWRNETDGSTSIFSYDNDSSSSTPIHDLMELTLVLVAVSLTASTVMAICSVLRFKGMALVAGTASIASLAVAAIFFYLLVGDSFGRSRLMMQLDPSFSGEDVSFGMHGEGEHYFVWGPEAGFWLAIVATGVLCLAVFFVTRSRGKD